MHVHVMYCDSFETESSDPPNKHFYFGYSYGKCCYYAIVLMVLPISFIMNIITNGAAYFLHNAYHYYYAGCGYAGCGYHSSVINCVTV